MTLQVLELCRDRFGKNPCLVVTVTRPDRLELALRSMDGVTHTWALTRGDVAMLRGALANMAEWERACIAAGLLEPETAMDRPAGMPTYQQTRPEAEG